MSKARLMQGNEACTEGALAAGVRFFGGYPITPSTEIAETMAKKLEEAAGLPPEGPRLRYKLPGMAKTEA